MQYSKIDTTFINSMSYTDFVGFINQWNVPPGAYSTVNKWAIFGRVAENSNVLEMACTTGFSLREISSLTGCRGFGIDLSQNSVETASLNRKLYSPLADVEYQCIDGYDYQTMDKFSHIIFGASLRFFPDPQRIIDKSILMLGDKGIILSCEFYVVKKIPGELVDEAKKVFGITITQEDYKKVMEIYKGFELIYEDKNVPEKETKSELAHYCKSTTDRACNMYEIKDKETYNAIYERIFKIKDMSNRLRPYQNYNILVHRYQKNVYPNRYVELF